MSHLTPVTIPSLLFPLCVDPYSDL